MESFSFTTPAKKSVAKRAHIGVVGSGDLEILLEPGTSGTTIFNVRTASEGFKETWRAVFKRFTVHHDIDAIITINDFGATPGVVSLRLAQAVEISNQTKK
ncbi:MULTISPECIES: malonate decarboxylase subunit delta [Chryseobacterium]|uniref:Malonate decarboxylase acyl carrier protein n=1 Tax=Chryseobacterium rhizosphaerae TaxID=395937 RepID=A0AAE4BZY9_9FLAO|nr:MULTISPECIES: malonate decarboxylase subunit delta [Chryseobacterium]MBL3547811.1 malonate decarboxylase subunit delta [Chryseobacterium sp. KMC2]MDR6524998.1 malonate decarboxylase delta subunit [Chryseobacterium rhizosphaerae]MDR6525031.1 malonate decarboxylase delta subunit [Chryseobacterium rhizosphaerae]MDR6548169.1 malonate decarboxylase delta subunit [Chryseobacterium rhizosphaerae]REC72631.1 malonate decarboxylase acyl carrier protein [Chryseobacterium rhizosphaerae]